MPFLTAEEEAEMRAELVQMRAEAWDWLAGRFSNVREEEISDDLARTIRTIKEWDAGCTGDLRRRDAGRLAGVCDAGAVLRSDED